ncbi:phosphoglycerate mutase-like protein [Pluteus cervinus]|uniref:Phosphoglycerate mutase-like protein n=1 Tax=Pluteus cervinus TaxID=181527 RepID=A0ACD3BHD7_9AGAR|nr:phosphoglycerate mutase-like protein [Pluteus cervinus]
MPAIEKIYIARHGFRVNWVTSNWTSPTGLPKDPPLTVFGVEQAKELGDFFLSLPEDERPTAIFSSPYYRCLQTAQPVAVALGLPLYVEHGISEWYSPVAPGTGLHPRPQSATVLQTYFKEIDPSWSSVWYPTRKGEDVDEVHERTDGFLKTFIPKVERQFGHRHQRILLVSHAATVITLARVLTGDMQLPLRVGCCSLSEFVRSSNDDVTGSWDAKRLAQGDHLKDGALRDWGLEDIRIADGKVIDDPGIPGTENEVETHFGRCPTLSSNL